MTFFIKYDKQPRKFLKKQDKNTSERIIDKIEETLKENPVPQDAKAIVGEHGVFRIRVGKIRALYRINYEKKEIIIVKTDNRDKVYD